MPAVLVFLIIIGRSFFPQKFYYFPEQSFNPNFSSLDSSSLDLLIALIAVVTVISGTILLLKTMKIQKPQFLETFEKPKFLKIFQKPKFLENAKSPINVKFDSRDEGLILLT